jgi:hypothetical protein
MVSWPQVALGEGHIGVVSPCWMKILNAIKVGLEGRPMHLNYHILDHRKTFLMKICTHPSKWQGLFWPKHLCTGKFHAALGITPLGFYPYPNHMYFVHANTHKMGFPTIQKMYPWTLWSTFWQ